MMRGLFLSFMALSAVSASYVAMSATKECIVPLSKEQCKAFREATPLFQDDYRQVIGDSPGSHSIGDFEVTDQYLPFGCQWFVDLANNQYNRFLYNEANEDDPTLSNEHNKFNKQCNSKSFWCYPTYSYRVCGGLHEDTDKGLNMLMALLIVSVVVLLLAIAMVFIAMTKKNKKIRLLAVPAEGQVEEGQVEVKGTVNKPVQKQDKQWHQQFTYWATSVLCPPSASQKLPPLPSDILSEAQSSKPVML